jgi:F-type H+-transporting ATPase subunit epsilon
MLKLEIVTPEKKVLDEDVESVSIPTASGEIGILPSHAPLVSAIRPGIVTYVGKGTSGKIAVASGFVDVSNDKVSLLVDNAATAADIDPELLRTEKDAADRAVNSAMMSVEEAEAAREAADLLAAKIAVAGK